MERGASLTLCAYMIFVFAIFGSNGNAEQRTDLIRTSCNKTSLSNLGGAEQCMVRGEDRYDCGYPGVTEEECVIGRGCCWNNTAHGVNWCFYPQPSPCDIPESRRFDCGHRLITPEGCEEKGCCWREAQNHSVPYCYHRRWSAQTEFHSTEDNQLWLPMHQTTFSFTVEACEDVTVYLTSAPRARRTSSYEVIIGSSHNTKSAIYKYVDGNLLGSATADSPNVLRCDTPTSFYLSWYGGHVSLSTSSSDDDVIVEWDDPSPVDINAVGVNNGIWKFSERAGQSIIIDSKETSPSVAQPDLWTEFEPGQTNVVFKVKACENAFIELTENRWTQGNAHGYEIILGQDGNSRSSFSRFNFGDEGRIDVTTPDVLDCDEYRHFWVSWKDGHVEVGEGQKVGMDRFMDKTYDVPEIIRYLSVTVRNDLRRSVSWEFYKWKEDHYTIKTPITSSDNVTFHANTRRTYFMFDVQACSNVFIYLSTDITNYRYGVQLGENNNSSRIIQYNNWPSAEEVLYERETPDILNCGEPRQFWLSWQNKRIAIGTGSKLHEHELLTFWDTANTQTITGIGFRSEDIGLAEWNFRADQVGKIVSIIPNQYKYDRLWYHAPENKYVQFRVQACEDAYIALGEYAGIVSGNTYEVVLGANGNTRSEIHDKGTGQTLRDVSGKILGCNTWTSVWISWKGKVLSVGTGNRVGASRLMAVYGMAYEVNAIGISSSSNNNGVTKWELDEPMGDVYEVFTKKETPDRMTKFLVYHRFFVFQVQACTEAIVSLLQDPESTAIDDRYVIKIGEDDNSRTSIYKSGARLATDRSDAVLDCNEKIPFWVSFDYNEKIIKVGKGSELGEQIITQYENPQLFFTRAVSISTDDDKEGRWTVPQTSVSGIRLITPSQYSYNYLWKSVSRATSVVFRVKACNDAHISLSSVASTPGLHDVSEVVIGASGNTKSLIRSGRLSENRVIADTMSVLACWEHRYFWISWLNGLIEVGKGSVVGAERLMSWQDPDPHPVATVAVSTGWGAVGDWELFLANEEFYVYMTGVQNHGDFDIVPTNTELEFAVLACEDAKLTLYKNYNEEIAYKLVIGGNSNTKVYIIRGDETDWQGDQESEAPGTLSCTESRAFRFRWGPAGFTLLGADGEFYLYWSDPDYIPVYSVKVSSAEQFQSWSFTRSEGESVRTSTSSDGDVNPAAKYLSTWISTNQQQYKLLRVKSCSNAHIMLASHIGLSQYSSYEIRLGTDTGTRSSIWKTGSPAACADTTTDDLLDCEEYRWIWVDWRGKHITVGQGDVLGEQIFLQCDKELDLRSLAIASDQGSDADWVFEDGTGEVYKFWTPMSYPYWMFHTAWVVPSDQFFTFDVQAHEWASLCLSYAPWRTGNNTYEIHIGRSESGGEDQYSSVIDKSTDEELVHVRTPKLVSYGKLNSFWVAWRGNHISVGVGHTPNQGVMIMRTDSNLYNPINAVSFTTPKCDGHWQFKRDQVRHVDMHTKNYDDKINTFEMTTRGLDRLVFQVRATNSAFLKLRVSVVDGAEKTYTLVIGGVDNTRTGLDVHPDPQTWQFAAVNVTPGILDYGEKRTFWLSWTNGVIQSGKGPVVGEELVLSYDDKNDIDITAVTMSNPRGKETAHWSLQQIQGNTFNIKTDAQYGYKGAWMALAKNELSFRVRACSDASVQLSRTLNRDNSTKYEIVFGGYSNRRLFVKRGLSSHPIAWTDLPTVVDCDRFLTFWLRWGGGNMTIGSGVQGSHVLLHAVDRVPLPIAYVSVSTGWGSAGEWQIPRGQEKVHLFTGDVKGADYETTSVMVQGHNYIQFNVTACQEAQVALSYVPHLVSVFTFEVTLGRNGSRGVSLKEEAGGEELTTAADSEALIHCSESSAFWVWWTTESLSVGRGRSVGDKEEQILTYPFSSHVAAPNSAQFRTPQGIPGEWVITGTGYQPEAIEGGLSGGAIAGIVIGVLLVIILAGTGVVFYRSAAARQRAGGVIESMRSVTWKRMNEGREAGSAAYVDPQEIARQVMGPVSYTPDTLFSK